MGERSIAVHPATQLPFLRSAKRCGQCRHYDEALACCDASKDRASTNPVAAACTRYLPIGRVGQLLATVSHHPRIAICTIGGAAAGYVSLVATLALR